MPELSVTEDQYDRLEAVRQDMEEAFVDSYGHVRPQDALEYLLDTYTPPDERNDERSASDIIATAEYPELQRVASDVSGVPGSGIDADEMRGQLLAELGPEEFAATLRAGPDAADESSPNDTGESSSGDVEESSPADGATGEGNSPGVPDGTAGGNGNPLSAANRLLNEHDDKWREGTGDTPYEVELPDGSTEPVRTKDDVRHLLFRHY